MTALHSPSESKRFYGRTHGDSRLLRQRSGVCEIELHPMLHNIETLRWG